MRQQNIYNRRATAKCRKEAFIPPLIQFAHQISYTAIAAYILTLFFMWGRPGLAKNLAFFSAIAFVLSGAVTVFAVVTPSDNAFLIRTSARSLVSLILLIISLIAYERGRGSKTNLGRAS